jgi:hypothetical protein
MLHKGARSTGGNLPADITTKITALLDEFADIVLETIRTRHLRRAVVRSMLTCSTINILDRRHLFVAAQKQSGMPSTIGFDQRDKEFPIQEVLAAAKWEFGFDDPFIIPFPTEVLDQPKELRRPVIEAIAAAHIESEVQRVERQMNVIQINPIFGPACYAVDQRLAFVLMPFSADLTEIYTAFIKPTVEDPQFGLVCRRADDVKSNKAIIQDIWKSICEARLVIADLSTLNPNVMYELGMAHTLGKETILIYQRGGEVKFPFDLAHIRRIEYVNDAPGGKKLEQELSQTLRSVLEPGLKAKDTE